MSRHRSTPVPSRRRAIALKVAAGLGVATICASLFINGTTVASWIDASYLKSGELQAGTMALTDATTNDRVAVGIWGSGQLVSVNDSVPLAEVRMQPRTAVTYSSTFTVSMIGNVRAAVKCAVTDSGAYSPLTQTTGVTDASGKAVPVAALSLKNGTTAITSSTPVKNGDVITATVTLTHPDTASYYKTAGGSLSLPPVSCTLEQVI